MADLELKRLGWYLSPEGIQECKEEDKSSTDDIVRAALDLDLKDIGKKHLLESTGKNKVDHIEGPVVLQIQKIRNVSAPKDNPDSQAAPPIFKLILSDGHNSCPAIEIEKINKLGLSTAPGTKVCLRGRVPLTSGFLQLTRSNCEVLGGRVQKLADNWQLKRTLAQQSRYNVGSEGSGPPPFVPFGQKRRPDEYTGSSKRDNFKSLDTRKEEEKKQNSEFEQQRRATIAAVNEVKEEHRGKMYGSGSMVKVNDRDVASIVEMGFTTDQATAALRQNNNNFNQALDTLLREKPSEPAPHSNTHHRNNGRPERTDRNDRSERIDRSDRSERMDRTERSDRMDRGDRSERMDRSDRSDRMDRSDRSDRMDRNDRSERMDRSERSDRVDRSDQSERIDRSDRSDRGERPERGRGRRGRDEEEDDEYRKGPSAPATIFDFMVNKNPSVITESKSGSDRPDRGSRLDRDSSKSSDTSDKRSTGSRDMGGPPNLPPRLMRQQRQKEEEARQRRNDQRPPPPPPYAANTHLNPQRQSRQRGGEEGVDRGGAPRQGYHQRTSYGPNKPMYDPHMRGPVQNRTLWQENGGGGRRNNYRNHQEYGGNQDPPRGYNNRRPNQRYSNKYDGNNVPPQHQHGYPQATGRMVDHSQYSNNNAHRPYARGNYQHLQQQMPTAVVQQSGHGYKHNRHHQNPAEQETVVVDTSSSVAPPEQEVKPEETCEVQSSQSSLAQEEPSSGVAAVDSGEVVEYVPETAPEYADDNHGNNDTLPDSSATASEVMVEEQQTVYVYQQNGELHPGALSAPPPQAAGGTFVTPIIPQMQQMTISGPPVATYQPYPSPGGGVHMDGGGGQPQQVYGGGGGMYATVEYSNSGPQSNTKNKDSNYGDNAYPSENSGKSSRHWKPGDYCMAKYWEDSQYYRAIVHQPDPGNGTLVVHFPDYGNLEQVVIKDVRPVPKNAWGSDETIIEPGEICTMLSLKPGKSSVSLKIKNYMEKEWISSKSIEEKPHELSVISFESNFGSVLDLGVHCENTKGFQKLSVYCPYWMINKTGRTLSYKRDKIGKNEQTGDDVASVHPEDYSGIVLFSFKSKSFFGKKKDDSDNLSLTGSEGSNNSPTGRKGKLKSPKRKKHSKKEDNRSLRKAVKASLKVSDSEWSDKFSLDTVGSSGTVSCKLKAKTYEDNSPSKKSPKMDTSSVLKRIGSTLSSTAMIGVSVGGPTQQGATKLNANQKTVRIKVGVNIQLSSSGLTKIVTFTPFFLLVNQAPYAIACKEVDVKDPKWWDLEPGDCKPFWPMQTDKVKRMVVKVKDTQTETLPFYYTDPHTTLCKLDSKHGGINVQCECHESSVEIMFQEYKPGFASVQLVNHTSDCVLTYIQQGVKNQEPLKVGAKQTSLYTWQDPNQKRELLWSCGEKKNEKNELLKDDIQSFFYNSDRKLYWVSFLDGMQRVLLFTEDIVVATLAQQAGELERLDQEITLSLRGMGLSLVNNHIRKEVAYMAITSSGVIWEEKKKKRFKALKMKQSATIEEAYQKFVDEIAIGKKPNSHVKLDGKIEVDFGETPPKMIRPRKCEIKRSFENGVWLQYRSSSHQMQFHMKIHRLQLDNQLPGAVFPTVLAPIPPPKSVAADSVPKPFTEMSIMIRKREFTNVMQFKYFKVLTQEMSVKVDQGFLNAVLTLFATDEVDEETQRQLLKTDMAVVDRPLMDYAVQSTADEQKHFYDMLHVSPLKVHLSFSLYGAEKDKDSPVQLKSNVLNLFLESVGIVLTDIQDVVFKLAYFERKYNFYNQSQLTGEITRHYSSQAIKQMYVLVLGLDVLGNPFGVIRGLAEGIEDLFYEPYQGAVQGPEEFAEGLALGVRSLLGHAVGGAAGAVSRITGALGKGIATLTLDDEYQKKRREQLNKRPADFKEGLARGGKGLVMGVFDGVTGIVRKPVEGAKEEGVAGFFKGVGKGLVGVVTRPTSGVVDFASGTFEGVKRVAEMSDEVRRVRPPRFLHRDGMVRPYLFKEAEGNDTLQDVEKGKYVTTDQYVAHLVITKDLKNVLLVTDKRVLFVSKGEIFGHWDCDWQYSWEELKEAPSVTQKGIQILLKEKEKKSFFKSGTMGKVIPFEDKQKAGWLVKKMSEAMQKNK